MTGVMRESFNNRSNRRGSWLGPLTSSHQTGLTDLSPVRIEVFTDNVATVYD